MTQAHLPADIVQRVHQQTTRAITSYRAGRWARGFDAWWTVGSALRVMVCWLGVLAIAWTVLRLAADLRSKRKNELVAQRGHATWLRGACCVLLVAGLVAAHGAAIAWIVMTGLDRYAVAMIPASAIATVAGWCLVRSRRNCPQ